MGKSVGKTRTLPVTSKWFMRDQMKNIIQRPVTKNPDLSIDLIRIIAMFAVVAIHVNSNFLYAWDEISWIDWWVSDIYSAMIHFAVPVFIILSGYLLLDKQEDDEVFFSKRFKKVIIPLIAWSMIYMVFTNNYNILSIITVNFVKQFLADKIYYHMYFLYIILGLYLITPLLRRILVHANMYDVYYYLILWFFITPVRQLIGLLGYNIELPLEVATGYLGYYIMGYAIKKTQITDKVINLSYIMAAVSIMATAVGSYILSKNSGKFDPFFTYGFSITTVVYSICLFILLLGATDNKKLPTSHIKIEKIIGVAAKASMGVYLVHPILLYYIINGLFGIFLLSAPFLSPIISVPTITILLVFVSLIIVTIMQRIPLIRKIVP